MCPNDHKTNFEKFEEWNSSIPSYPNSYYTISHYLMWEPTFQKELPFERPQEQEHGNTEESSDPELDGLQVQPFAWNAHPFLTFPAQQRMCGLHPNSFKDLWQSLLPVLSPPPKKSHTHFCLKGGIPIKEAIFSF